MKQNEKIYAYWLASVDGIGFECYRRLEEVGITPQEIYEMPPKKIMELHKKGIIGKRGVEGLLLQKEIDPKDNYEKLQKIGINVVMPMEAIYPKRLLRIPDPPLTLYYRNCVPKECDICVAVVGTRECTEYGRFVAHELGKTLAKQGVQMISGLARGIDGISQQSALEHNGSVFGVLGSGVDVCYPKTNRELYEEMWARENCGIISEYLPGTKARPSLFPPRNRIISGLSDVVVVVEARLKSGTFITVDAALEQGKEVFVVPGRVTDRHSDGCNRLIKDGAGVLLSPEEFVMELKQNFGEVKKKINQEQCQMLEEMHWKWNREEKIIYGILDVIPKTMEQIRAESGVAAEKVMDILLHMELTGAVYRIGNCYVKRMKNTEKS